MFDFLHLRVVRLLLDGREKTESRNVNVEHGIVMWKWKWKGFNLISNHCVKTVQIQSYFWYFPVFGMNKEIYGVYRENMDHKYSEYGQFSCSENVIRTL